MEHADASAESRELVLKVTLDDSDPLIWRRLRVSDSMSLGELHYALQIAMGWTNSHLHEFAIGILRYRMAACEILDLPPALDENEHKLRDLSLKPGALFKYIYDFGDEWEHTVCIEQEVSPHPAFPCPGCIAGERGCPPEDCGGISGYLSMLEILGDPENADFPDLQEWLPDDFDPEAFNMPVVNAKLENLCAFGIMAGPADCADEEDEEDYPEQLYEDPVCRLLTLGGELEPETDYSTLGIGQEYVPDLIRMATDMHLHLGDQRSTDVWAPVHAWRALAQLNAEEAIGPLVELFDLVDEHDDEYAASDLPKVLARFGLAALPALTTYLADSSKGTWSLIAAEEAMGHLGGAFPEHRDACVKALTDQLQKYDENDEELNAFLISSLVDLDAVESAPVMESAFKADRVNWAVRGDWEDVQITLGLLKKRITPPPILGWLRPRKSSRFETYPITPLPPPSVKKSQKSKKKRKEQAKSRKKNRRK